MTGPLAAPERVLPTLNPDGTRNRVRPKTFRGRYYRARFIVAWFLLATFVGLPFVRVGGKQAIVLDIPGRQFVFFGFTFLSTDGVVLMLALLAVFIGIILLSALLGRVWCGWGCPQTVYMEFVFRPVEQWLEGTRSQQLALDREGPNGRRLLKTAFFAVLSVLVANVFVAYFAGTDRLLAWATGSPFAHPAAFGAMLITAVLVFIDFAYFREQMCTVACPYARLQSVLLDRHSLVVGYDRERGEPRSRKSAKGSGDCVDCNNCVVACPTGIDIREGLQLDCIACTQCMDACDWVMTKLGRPTGLIRYGSQESLENRRPPRVVRMRVIIYSLILLVVVAALLFVQLGRGTADVIVLRGLGTPYVIEGDSVRNLLRIKVENRSPVAQEYHIELLGVPDARLIAPVNPLPVPPGEHQTTMVFVTAPRSNFAHGDLPIEVRVWDGDKYDRTFPYKLLGPHWGTAHGSGPVTPAASAPGSAP